MAWTWGKGEDVRGEFKVIKIFAWAVRRLELLLMRWRGHKEFGFVHVKFEKPLSVPNGDVE